MLALSACANTDVSHKKISGPTCDLKVGWSELALFQCACVKVDGQPVVKKTGETTTQFGVVRTYACAVDPALQAGSYAVVTVGNGKIESFAR